MSGTVLIAGGGTGGHVFPSLAVAAALRDTGVVDVEFIGTARGVESRLVPEAGWTLHPVDTLPLARRLSPSTARIPVVVLRAARQALAVIRSRRAVAAVVFGGYVSVPLAIAAWRARIPLIVHEQNAVPGLANRLAGRWASAVATTHPGRRFGRVLPVVTGNPVRPGLDPQAVAGTRSEALAHFGLQLERRTLLIFGGSQGARRINTAVVDSAGRWPDSARLQILHAAGRGNYEEVAAAWKAALTDDDALVVRCVDFIDRMELAYAVSDVVVCRSGASTLAELTVLGLPSILVPYPHATGDHQTANARRVADAGGAVLIPDGELDAERLVAEAQPLLGDDARRARMAAAAGTVGRPDAARQVAALVLEQIERRKAAR
ncbi:MAG: undecaprenyldiphospho-muramoylpentapeptide beta-N-acetylglucosaminyltransferase [Nitriliruptorales bacterium]|nr:undecaprenyldiphospho-muramoylpentapeptide beta-N-acetylglucosaminyltransferase [Nitriliruptorales bacterium]